MTATPADGAALHAFATELYPICRSITGNGLRKTLDLIGQRIELKRREIPSGSRIFDWEVPLEWNIDDACVLDGHGRRVVDFQAHNLHILNYSEPARLRLTLDELRPRIYSLPDHPDWIPYRTSYYRRQWGFCMRHRDLALLQPGTYEVRVDSRLEPGALSYGECVLPGRSKQEVLIFTHVCHPSLANDNLSGVAVATYLAQWIASAPRHFTYRFVFAPTTIGSLCWLKVNEQRLGRIAHGLILALLGDPASLTYKFSRRGDCEIDRVVPYVLRGLDPNAATMPFEAFGYDERQFCSPGFNLPMGRLTRSFNAGYAQYHSSADDLELVSAQQLQRSLDALKLVVEVLDSNRRYINLSPKGEPRLGKRGLYGSVGGRSPAERERAMLWVLNQSEGKTSLLDIAERSGIGYRDTQLAAEALATAGLLRDADRPRTATAAKPRPAPAQQRSGSKGRTRKKKRARAG